MNEKKYYEIKIDIGQGVAMPNEDGSSIKFKFRGVELVSEVAKFSHKSYCYWN